MPVPLDSAEVMPDQSRMGLILLQISHPPPYRLFTGIDFRDDDREFAQPEALVRAIEMGFSGSSKSRPSQYYDTS